MRNNQLTTQFAVCLNNENYSASLEPKKIYQVIPDRQASKHHLMRVIDESGEDYLYPEKYFVLIDVPPAFLEAFSAEKF